MVVHPGAVVVLPVDGEYVYLERQWRPSVGRWLIEAPAGTLEEGESPEDCALRELREETGIAAGTLEPAGKFYSSPGYSTEVLHMFLASDLSVGEPSPEPGERIEVLRVSLREAVRWVMEGRIEDGKTALLILLASSKAISLSQEQRGQSGQG